MLRNECAFCYQVHLHTPGITLYFLDFQEKFTDTSLGSIFDVSSGAFCGDVQVQLVTDAERYSRENDAHEAAYDAYMTGVVFARMVGGMQMRV